MNTARFFRKGRTTEKEDILKFCLESRDICAQNAHDARYKDFDDAQHQYYSAQYDALTNVIEYITSMK